MAVKPATTRSAGPERRRHARTDVAAAVMVSPNGHENRTTVFDLSESGARIGLPADFEHGAGATVRLYFPRTQGAVIVNARILRVAVDHLGVEFAPGQEGAVLQLIDELSDGN
jgi:hypothetical protein